jgi:hypothetical protein
MAPHQATSTEANSRLSAGGTRSPYEPSAHESSPEKGDQWPRGGSRSPPSREARLTTSANWVGRGEGPTSSSHRWTQLTEGTENAIFIPAPKAPAAPTIARRSDQSNFGFSDGSSSSRRPLTTSTTRPATPSRCAKERTTAVASRGLRCVRTTTQTQVGCHRRLLSLPFSPTPLGLDTKSTPLR